MDVDVCQKRGLFVVVDAIFNMDTVGKESDKHPASFLADLMKPGSFRVASL